VTEIASVGVPTAEERPTLNVWPETGRLLGLSKAATYAAVQSGELPAIRVGRRLLIPTAKLRRMLGLDDDAPKGTPGEAA
jgi:excisionase family DNA binding protein